MLGENISQTAQFVQSGNADVGLLALSLAVAPAMKTSGRYVEIPATDYPPLIQAGVILKSSQNRELAEQFLKFLKEPGTVALMEQYGFAIPRDVAAAAAKCPRHTDADGLERDFPDAPARAGRLRDSADSRHADRLWLSFTRWRWKFFVESIVALPLVLPPTVLGFYVWSRWARAARSAGGISRSPAMDLAFTFEGLAIASVIYSLPFAVQPMTAAFSQVDRNLINASSILGASRIRTFIRVVLPLSLSGVVTGFVLSFAHTLGEFGVVLMVGGNIPGVSEVLDRDLRHMQALDYSAPIAWRCC